MIGFYVLSLTVVAALLFAIYVMIAYGHLINPYLVLVVILAAGTVLWSITPRRDHFVPPGPILTRHDQPDFLEAVDGVAEATGQRAPAEIYLVPLMNMGVSNRGGLMGIGSRRVMVIGLPLL